MVLRKAAQAAMACVVRVLYKLMKALRMHPAVPQHLPGMKCATLRVVTSVTHLCICREASAGRFMAWPHRACATTKAVVQGPCQAQPRPSSYSLHAGRRDCCTCCCPMCCISRQMWHVLQLSLMHMRPGTHSSHSSSRTSGLGSCVPTMQCRHISRACHAMPHVWRCMVTPRGGIQMRSHCHGLSGASGAPGGQAERLKTRSHRGPCRMPLHPHEVSHDLSRVSIQTP